MPISVLYCLYSEYYFFSNVMFYLEYFPFFYYYSLMPKLSHISTYIFCFVLFYSAIIIFKMTERAPQDVLWKRSTKCVASGNFPSWLLPWFLHSSLIYEILVTVLTGWKYTSKTLHVKMILSANFFTAWHNMWMLLREHSWGHLL